jgi:hypothetical protein
MTEQKDLFTEAEQQKLDAEHKRVLERQLILKIQAEARNKIPPKPPVVDDDGNDIPF